MHVLITGGAGSVGLPLVKRLIGNGHRVRVVGRSEGIHVPDAEYMPCDICDYDRVVQVMKGTDSVIHLAALPAPDKGSPQELYRINCAGTFNIYQAAVSLGVNRVVTASSINALGYFYGLKGFSLSYLPVDEEHPTFATDAYSLSKVNVEELGRYFWEREGITGVSLRIPGVYSHEGKRLDGFKKSVGWAAEYLYPKFEWAAERKKEWAAELAAKYQAFRNHRPFEWRPNGKSFWTDHNDSMEEDESRLFFTKTNLFASLDARDSALAFELALTGNYGGYHTLFVNDSHNGVGLPARELASLVYPEAVSRVELLGGTTSLVSIDKARELLGFEPEHSLSRIFV